MRSANGTVAVTLNWDFVTLQMMKHQVKTLPYSSRKLFESQLESISCSHKYKGSRFSVSCAQRIMMITTVANWLKPLPFIVSSNKDSFFCGKSDQLSINDTSTFCCCPPAISFTRSHKIFCTLKCLRGICNDAAKDQSKSKSNQNSKY